MHPFMLTSVNYNDHFGVGVFLGLVIGVLVCVVGFLLWKTLRQERKP